MSLLSEVRLTVSRRVNLGNYEHVEMQASVLISRDRDDDTPSDLRDRAVDEVNAILEEAYRDHVPARRRGEAKVSHKED